MKTQADIAPFAALLEQQQREAFTRDYPGAYLEERRDSACTVKVSMGKKFARVDIGNSGKYMVDLETGDIYGIKAYGVVHRGHRYGTLETIGEWDWSGYVAQRKQAASSLYDELKGAGIPLDNHESDLYFLDTPESRAILARFPEKASIAKPFVCMNDRKDWIDVFWDAVKTR